MDYCRYAIIADYFGKFDDQAIIATTDNIHDAKFICDTMNEALKDRPFDILYKKLADDYDPDLDDLESGNLFASQKEGD